MLVSAFMNGAEIYGLVEQFRVAIENTLKAGFFIEDNFENSIT